MKQTTLRTYSLNKTKNISFPIGTIRCIQQYNAKLGFEKFFSKYKQKGIPLPNLVEGLLSYRLTENQSITQASDWLNRPEVLSEFVIKSFEQRTLFRALELLGANREEIVFDVQSRLFSLYDFEHTNINMDWTSFILWGKKSSLGAYGYSRDHRPDKKQITMGLAELAKPINIPIGLTINAGNMSDQEHFSKTYAQVKGRLKRDSMVIVDKGANSKDNMEQISGNLMKYLTAKKLNKSDDKRIKAFDKSKAELVDAEQGIYGIKYEFPSRIDYFYFSERLRDQQIEAKIRKAKRQLEEARQIQHSLDKHKQLPKKFRINNALVDVTYSYQTKLSELNETEALEVLKKANISGREGFFCLTSNKDLTLKEALVLYRQKDSIEKIINSLKNEIEIKPLRVWTDNSIYGALIIGFLAQLIISLIRFDYEELKNTSTKFIKISLMNLTVTVEKMKNRLKRFIYSNFDPVNELILLQKQGIT